MRSRGRIVVGTLGLAIGNTPGGGDHNVHFKGGPGQSYDLHRSGHWQIPDTSDEDTVVWGTSDEDTVVWGTSDGEDTVVWGTDQGGDTVVWGTACQDPSCEPPLWEK